MTNLHYLFNVKYYESLPTPLYGDHNKTLTEQQFKQDDSGTIRFCTDSFVLKTVYPGLLLGLGNAHEAGSALLAGNSASETEIKLGFSMDYVTGLPVIPGSTVKGVLRSAFSAYPDYIASLLPPVSPSVVSLEEVIFGSDDMGKIIFYDAVPVKPGRSGRIFGLENITPHKAKDPDYTGLVNPTPLKLLKVIPGVSFIFRFSFNRWDEHVLTADHLLKVFKEILLTLGIGAKTNVGFGGMAIADEMEEYRELIPALPKPANSLPASQPASASASAQPSAKHNVGKCAECGAAVNMRPDGSGYYKFCYKCAQNNLSRY